MNLYDKYKNLKEKDGNKMYLFKNGNFYIFLDEDADNINEYVVLKKTNFSKNVQKCGFPVSSKDAYLKVFQNHGLDIQIIESSGEDSVVNKLENINLDQMTPIEALNLLYEWQGKQK